MTNNQCNRQCSLLHIRGRGECQVLALFDQQFSLSLSLALCMLHLHSNRPRFAVSNPTVGCLRAQLSVTQAPAASSDMHRQAHSSQLFVVARPRPTKPASSRSRRRRQNRYLTPPLAAVRSGTCAGVQNQMVGFRISGKCPPFPAHQPFPFPFHSNAAAPKGITERWGLGGSLIKIKINS